MADSPTEITKKIEDAYNAKKTWANTSFHDRRRVMRSLKKWLVDNQETCAKVACRDTGKTSEWLPPSSVAGAPRRTTRVAHVRTA